MAQRWAPHAFPKWTCAGYLSSTHQAADTACGHSESAQVSPSDFASSRHIAVFLYDVILVLI